MIRCCMLLCCMMSITFVQAQQTIITGKVIERSTNEPLPFVTVGLKGTKFGTTTDFEGNFKLTTSAAADSLVFTFIGFKTQTVFIQSGKTNNLLIKLEPTSNTLKETVIRPKENPALRIVNQAVDRRKYNDVNLLDAYECESYNKTDVSLNNISEKMKKNKLLQPLKAMFDTANQMKNEDGKYIIPIFISETQSKYYYNKNINRGKEIILANSLIGFGVKEGSYIVDMLGSSLIQFNFSDNRIRFLAKDFVSPVSSSCHNYYWYTMYDSVMIDGMKCYEVNFKLKRESDLGFNGTMWIADSSFAIRRIYCEISKNANLNFIDRLKIQQEQLPTAAGPWLPMKTRLIVELSRFTDNTTGFVAKMYRSNNNVVVNKIRPETFYDTPIERETVDLEQDSSYWQKVRPEKISATEQRMFNQIDSMKRLPIVKTYTEVIRILTEGYYRLEKFEIGPYIYMLNFNNVEGIRTRMGLRTTQKFSKKWFFNGYLAYGFKDEKFKYGGGIDYIVNQKHWTTLGVSFKNDNDILGVSDPSSTPMQAFGSGGNYTLATLNMGAALSRINQTIDYRLVWLRQMHRDWTIRMSIQNTYFKPLGDFYFAYKIDDQKPATVDNLRHTFTYTAARIDLRFAYKEILIPRGIQRIRLKLATAPVTTLTYMRGIGGFAEGDFSFDRLQLNFNQHITTGIFGNADYNISAGKIFGQLPYPILEVMRGNNSVLYSDNNFSLMNLYEFVADEYIHFWYVQHFEGLIFNRIPVLKKWKLRNYALVKGAYGTLTDENKNVKTAFDLNGRSVLPVYEFKNEPYLEVGYGIENLFRFVTLGAVHRLTYLNNVNVRRWGINVGFIFQF